MATTHIDQKVAKVLDTQPRTKDEDSDDDALIASLEAEEESSAFSALREKRLNQLQQELNKAKILKNSQHGTYLEIKDEKQILEITTSTKLCIVHFMKPDFNRCRIMDEKLRVLAEKHYETRFVSVNVENAPFLVVKLGVQVLPCVIAFKDGVSVDRVIGFEGIGARLESFTARELEAKLLGCGVLVRAKMGKEEGWTGGKAEKEREEVFDEDEWD